MFLRLVTLQLSHPRLHVRLRVYFFRCALSRKNLNLIKFMGSDKIVAWRKALSRSRCYVTEMRDEDGETTSLQGNGQQKDSHQIFALTAGEKAN